MAGTPICPHCDEQIVSLFAWNMELDRGGRVVLMLCPHCSRILGVLRAPDE